VDPSLVISSCPSCPKGSSGAAVEYTPLLWNKPYISLFVKKKKEKKLRIWQGGSIGYIIYNIYIIPCGRYGRSGRSPSPTGAFLTRPKIYVEISIGPTTVSWYLGVSTTKDRHLGKFEIT
jgi:hypothetical protein